MDVDRHDLFGINALLWPRGPKSGSRAHCSWGPGASRGQGLKGACSVVRADPLCESGDGGLWETRSKRDHNQAGGEEEEAG